MSHPSITREECFALIVGELLNYPNVIPPLDGPQAKKRFAMLVRGRLVVKLPKARVDALVASGDRERFDPRHDGRLMKEWIILEPTTTEKWLPLAQEAREFVAAKR